MTALRLEEASKHYPGTTALDAVSLTFPADAITAVIGPSGCGKSTLLKLLNGLEQPDGGRVIAFGEALDYGNLPPLRRRMGYAVQGTGLFPHLSARDNITLLAQLARWSDADISTRLEALLELSQLEATQLDRYPHQLSGGQQQRVGLCRAMMLKPEVLLLDEPFGAIDPITRSDIQAQLLALHRAEPRTTVLVTHDMAEALKLADHLVIMAGGRIAHSEAKDSLLATHPGSDPETLLHQLLQEAQA